MVYSRGPSHRTKSFGSVCALKTSSRGASNCLVIKDSCLHGSALITVFFVFIGVLASFEPLFVRVLSSCAARAVPSVHRESSFLQGGHPSVHNFLPRTGGSFPPRWRPHE